MHKEVFQGEFSKAPGGDLKAQGNVLKPLG